MEHDTPFETYKPRILPTPAEVAQWIAEHITLLPPKTDLSTSEHIRSSELHKD